MVHLAMAVRTVGSLEDMETMCTFPWEVRWVSFGSGDVVLLLVSFVGVLVGVGVVLVEYNRALAKFGIEETR